MLSMQTARVLRAFFQSLVRRERFGSLKRRSKREAFRFFLQVLEPRLALSAPGAPPPVVMISAMTTNSKSVTIDYRIDQTPIPGPSTVLQLGVYRSSNPQFDSSASQVSTWTISMQGQAGLPLDDNGQPAASLGTHRLTIPLPAGLPPDPLKPYVLVVADPATGTATQNPEQTAAFRTYVIGIVTHGGLINSSWKHGPPWQLQTAVIMRQQGYDAVIPYAWVTDSSKPGRAAMQGPLLARKVLDVASQFPTGAPVDLHFIGHSEGTVVNTQAIVSLEKHMTPEIRSGYIEDTLLDPHAANNNVPGQYSVSGGFLGALAKALIHRYQAQANDPPVFIPQGVDAAQVFYQHTQASHDHGVNQGLYNLWGQVPVPNLSGNPIAYYNLTGAGATHSGNYGVALWYRNFVAPTLGSQAPLVQTLRLEGQIDQATTMVPNSRTTNQARVQTWDPVRIAQGAEPEFSGTAAPGSTVRVYLGPAANPSVISPAGQTRAGATGEWSFTPRTLKSGCYRGVAMAFQRASRTRPGLTIVPMTPLGRITIEGAANK
jgi:hypothetical protein